MNTTGSDPLATFAAQGAIDLAAFIGTWPWRLQASADAARLGELADRMSLQGLCVSHLASIFGYDTRSGNDALWREVEADDRLWPFAIINPTEPGWVDELDRAERNAARGVRLVPAYQGYRLDSPAVADLFEATDAAGLPVQVCLNLDDERVRHRRYAVDSITDAEIAELLRTRAGRPIGLSGVKFSDWPAIAAHLDHGHDLSKVLVDLWFTNGPVGAIGDLCHDGLDSLFGFGSCEPVQVALATAYQLGAAGIAEDQLARLCAGNAQRWLS
jgi:hypothetical protein